MKGFLKKEKTKKTEVESKANTPDPKAIGEAIDLMDAKVSALNKEAEKILELVGKIH